MSWISRTKAEKVGADVVSSVQTAPLVAREKLTPYVEVARERVDTARELVTPYVETARERVTPYVDTAKDRVTPYVENARDWAGPRVEDAKHRAAPVVAGAVDKYVPKIEHALDDASSKLVTVLESTGPARYEVQRRGTAAVAALKGEIAVPEKKSSRWGRRFLVVSLFTGLGAAAFAFFRRRKDDDAWITTDTYPTYGGAASPAEPSTTTRVDTTAEASTAPVVIDEANAEVGVDVTNGSIVDVAEEDVPSTDDAGGASPDEALADATDEPVEPTTPDEPVERVTPKDIAEHIHPHRED